MYSLHNEKYRYGYTIKRIKLYMLSGVILEIRIPGAVPGYVIFAWYRIYYPVDMVMISLQVLHTAP